VILPFKEFNFVQRDALPSPGLLRSVQVGLSHLAVVPAFRVSREFHTGARGRRGLKEEEERERDLFCLGVETRFFSFSFSCSSSPSVRTETSPSKCCSRASPVNSTQLNSTRLDSTAGVHAAYTRRSCRFKQRLRSPVRFIQVFAVLLCPSTCLRAFGSPFLLPLLPPLLLLKAVSNHQLFSGAFPPRRSSSSSSPSSSSSHPPPCKP
jgi:hypothetical protein